MPLMFEKITDKADTKLQIIHIKILGVFAHVKIAQMHFFLSFSAIWECARLLNNCFTVKIAASIKRNSSKRARFNSA